VVIFSPEPSDEVLGMGGTLRRLVEQGHDVTVVYLSSGNLAVPDEEAAMATDLVLALAAEHRSGEKNPEADFAREVYRQLEKKNAFAADTPAVRKLKGLIRRAEANASVKVCGLAVERIRFLDLPFYETGRYRQFQLGPADHAAVAEVLQALRPHQIFATGLSEDPNSVAALGFDLVRQALAKTTAEAWQKDCRVWLYRPAERGWAVDEIDMAVPFSPHELAAKMRAIYHHKSQRSQGPGAAGTDEAWQQAERQNRELATAYDQLGLAEYEAIEAFQRWQL
jgi:glucosamine-6-phosphate deaminase